MKNKSSNIDKTKRILVYIVILLLIIDMFLYFIDCKNNFTSDLEYEYYCDSIQNNDPNYHNILNKTDNYHNYIEKCNKYNIGRFNWQVQK